MNDLDTIDDSVFLIKEKSLSPEQINFQSNIKKILTELETILIEKNIKYGNSALKPKRIFSKASPEEQLKVRIDDKLSRISNMGSDVSLDEDTVLDLIGYLVLYKISLLNKTLIKE